MVWFWGESTPPDIPSFTRLFGKTGAVIAAVDLIRGLGKMVGLKVIDVPGATGYIDTNYLGKGKYSVSALQERDFVWTHVEAADEAGHERDIDQEIEAIQNMDALVLGTILDGLKQIGENARILLLPDHPTPIRTGAHSPEMVPFMLYDSTNPVANNLPMDERGARESKLQIQHAPDLMKMLFESAE